MHEWELANPPLWESGVYAQTSLPAVVDHYEISAVHDLFRDRFPRAERQPQVAEIGPFPQVGDQINLSQEISFQQSPDYIRWWFVSEDGRNLMQLQDNMVSRNWRRTDTSPASDQDYPNFQTMLDDFRSSITMLRDRSVNQGGSFPQPRIASCFFMNIIPLKSATGEKLRVKEALPFINFSDDVLKRAFNANWIEAVPLDSSVRDMSMSVTVLLGGFVAPSFNGETLPQSSAHLRFEVRSLCESWEECFHQMDSAHAYVRKRLRDLTSGTIQATWLA